MIEKLTMAWAVQVMGVSVLSAISLNEVKMGSRMFLVAWVGLMCWVSPRFPGLSMSAAELGLFRTSRRM